jgi:hypothetical protein
VSFLLYVDCVFSLVRRLCLSLVRRLYLFAQEERHNLRTREKTQSTHTRKDTIYVQEKSHNLRTRGKTQYTYKRKDAIYVQEERHNLRTRDVDCVFPLVRRLCLSSCTYIVSFLLYVDCVFPLVPRLCLFSCTYVQEKRYNLRTREKTQSTYKRKDTIYVQEERHNLRTRGKTQSTYKRKDTIYVLFPLVRRLCLFSYM